MSAEQVSMARKTDKERERKIMRRFVEVFCRKRHGTRSGEVCPDCLDLIAYAEKRLDRCPYDPKPKCKDCSTHCYKPDYRARMREVMKFSGMCFVKRGRVDWLVKYFMS